MDKDGKKEKMEGGEGSRREENTGHLRTDINFVIEESGKIMS